MKPAKFTWGQRVSIKIDAYKNPSESYFFKYNGYAARISDHSRSSGHEYALKVYKNGRCVNEIAWVPEHRLEAR